MRDQWPTDSVIVIAAPLDKVVKPRADSCVTVRCRDCNQKLGANPISILRAANHRDAQGRPVDFFCMDCAVQYDRNSIQDIIDDRQKPNLN